MRSAAGVGLSHFGTNIPLQFDPILERTFAGWYPPGLLPTGMQGVLDPVAAAQASLTIAPNTLGGWVGRSLAFACISLAPGGAIPQASSASWVWTFVP